MDFKYVVREGFHLDGQMVDAGTVLADNQAKELTDAVALAQASFAPGFVPPKTGFDANTVAIAGEDAQHKLSLCVRVDASAHNGPAPIIQGAPKPPPLGFPPAS